MTTPRIVVTGLGGLCCLGSNAGEIWDAMRNGVCGIGPLTIADKHDLKTAIAGQIVELPEHDFDQRKLASTGRFGLLAALAADEALRQAGLSANERPGMRIGSVIGVGVYGADSVEQAYRDVFLGGRKRTEILTVPRAMPSSAAVHVSMLHGLNGPVFGVTSACASGNHAFSTALDMLRSGRADAIVAGGSDAPLSYGIVKAWEAMRILAKDRLPALFRRPRGPCPRRRSGRIGARNAGKRGDGAARRSSPNSPAPACRRTPATSSPRHWRGRSRRCANASPMPGSTFPRSITSMPTARRRSATTRPRLQAIREVFGAHADKLSVSSTKSMHAHCLGASSALEAIACIQAIRDGIVPPTVNYTEPDPECDLDVTPNKARERPVSVALSNAFAFGGANAVVAFKAF
jgi:nodulation protein E